MRGVRRVARDEIDERDEGGETREGGRDTLLFDQEIKGIFFIFLFFFAHKVEFNSRPIVRPMRRLLVLCILATVALAIVVRTNGQEGGSNTSATSLGREADSVWNTPVTAGDSDEMERCRKLLKDNQVSSPAPSCGGATDSAGDVDADADAHNGCRRGRVRGHVRGRICVGRVHIRIRHTAR